MQDEANFEIEDLLGIGMTFVVLVIGMAYGMQVTGEIKGDMCTTDGYTWSGTDCYTNGYQNVTAPTSLEYNSTGTGITALAKIPDKLGTIVTIVIAAVIIGVLTRYLWMNFVN